MRRCINFQINTEIQKRPKKMNFFGGIKSVLGSPAAGNQPSPHETVERLCDRVSSSTLLEDRRDAVRALKSLSKKFRLEVGTQSMELLIGVLQTERNDTEIIGMALETLCNIMSTDPQMQDGQSPATNGPAPSDADVGLQFTEIFIKNPDNVTLLLGILEEYDFHVRWPTVKLLTMLLTNKPNLLQQCILVSPMGVSRLMDLLSDSREIIRNEGLLLLIQLTKSNAAIQKIVAFENAFDRLLEIIAEEGYSDGGIVVEDCLLLMNNLLKDNVSNQNFFREGSFIQRFTPFFEMSALAMQGDGETGWSEQKVSNVQLMLKVVRILVSPDNPQQATTSAQKIMNQSGLLKLLCGILMASGIPADILTETINAVSEVIRGFPANQDYFSQVNAPSEPPRPAIVVLLMSMINEKQPFSLRCAVLYCFQCYLYKNEQGQSQIVSTLLPSSADVAASVSAGQLLCAGLFSHDPVSNWCAAVALSHCLKGNPTQKEQLLRVQLATSLGNPPVSLLQQCTNILAQGGDIQTRVGLLLLLCSWLSNCPIAVAHFLHNSANVPYLMAQVESHGEEGERLVGYLCGLLLGLCVAFNDDSVEKFKKDDLRLLINKRTGLDNLLEKIGYISKSEYFTAAVKSPEIKGDGSQLVLFDHEFTKLFKKLDAAVTKVMEETTEAPQTTNQKNDSIENHDSIVQSYKELIREQDEELGKIKSRYADMESTYNQANTQIQIQAQEILQLRSQLSLMQSYNQHQQEQAELNGSYVPVESQDVSNLRLRMSELQLNKQELETKLKEKEERVQRLEKDLEVSQAQYAVATAAAELADSCDSSELAAGLTRNQLEDLAGLRRTVSSLEQEVGSLRTQNASLQKELESFKTHGTVTSGTQLQMNERIRELETRLAQVNEEKDSQTQEHEDLLVMLTEQGEKLATYKKTLKDLGQEVSADEDEDEEDDDDDEEEEEEEENDAKEEGDNQVNYQPEEQLTQKIAETPQEAPEDGLQEDEPSHSTKEEVQEEPEEIRYPVEEHAPKDPSSYPALEEEAQPDHRQMEPPAHQEHGFHEQAPTEPYLRFQDQDQSESAFYQGEGYHTSQEQAPTEPYYPSQEQEDQMKSYPAQTESSGYHPSQEQGHMESFGYAAFQDQSYSYYDPYQNPHHDAGYALQEQAHAHQQAPFPYAVEEQANIKPKPVPFFNFPQNTNTNQPNNFSNSSQSDDIKQDAGLMMDNGEPNFFS